MFPQIRCAAIVSFGKYDPTGDRFQPAATAVFALCECCSSTCRWSDVTWSRSASSSSPDVLWYRSLARIVVCESVLGSVDVLWSARRVELNRAPAETLVWFGVVLSGSVMVSGFLLSVWPQLTTFWVQFALLAGSLPKFRSASAHFKCFKGFRVSPSRFRLK